MADATDMVFNRKAVERLRNPDDLDKFVRVTNPSAWLVLAACFALLVGLLAWGMFGTVATNISTLGACIDGVPMCFLSADQASKVHVGDTANFGDRLLSVASISDVPASRNELSDLIKNDYLVSSLAQDDWAYIVRFEGDSSGLKSGVPISLSITIDQIAPMSLLSRDVDQS